MTALFILLSSIIGITENTIPDAPTFIDSIYEKMNDTFFEYEGLAKVKIPAADAWHDKDNFSGSILFRKDGAIKLESIHLVTSPNSEPMKKHFMLSSLKGMSLKYEGHDDLRGAEKKVSSFTEMYYPGSISRIYMVPYIQALAYSPKTRLVHEGDTVIDNHKCEIFSFVMGKDYETTTIKNASGLFRFYLDMERGGHPLKAELIIANEINWQVGGIQLEQFATPTGAKFWLPTSGRFETLFPRNSKYEGEYKPGEVVNLETYSVMKGSVKINKLPDDKMFILKLKDGTVITDKIKNKRTRQGETVKSKPVNLEQAEAQLKALIKEGEMNGQEVKATSIAKGGGGTFTSWLPTILSVFATVVLIVSLVFYWKGIKS